ncbi:hypothetical protein RR46_08424 [Papilio xuthus]|uniref:Uncharacterized protein n=1 Tax=Papilio xuthus TaxID=66420 RepID=A0A194PG43_PAPXU|nr:hypothetical protein RR46_08424 [Papilio xuthus]
MPPSRRLFEGATVHCLKLSEYSGLCVHCLSACYNNVCRVFAEKAGRRESAHELVELQEPALSVWRGRLAARSPRSPPACRV